MQFWDKSSTFAIEMNLSTFIKSANVRNFASLLSANVVAQVIGLLVYPILTRIYAPEDFGLLNLFLSIGGVLIVLSTAEYYYAIVLPKQDKEAVNVVCVGLITLLIVSGLVALSVFFAEPLSRLFDSPLLATYYWLLPIYVFLMGAWNLLNYWYVRRSNYRGISSYQISQSVLSSGAKVGLGYAGVLQGGMIYSVVLGPLLSILGSLSIQHLRKRLLSGQWSWRDISWHSIRTQAKAYRNFPVFVMPRSFVNMLAGQLPVLLLTPFFGAKFVGFYSIALLLGYTPIGTITRAVYQVLYQHTTERVHNAQPIGRIFKHFILGASAIMIPLFVGIGFILPDLTSWLFGAEWYVSGEYIRWMLPWLFVSFLSCSINYLFDVFMQQKAGLILEILLAVCRTIGLLIGVYMNSFVMAIALYSIGTALALIVQIIWMLRMVRRYDQSLIS